MQSNARNFQAMVYPPAVATRPKCGMTCASHGFRPFPEGVRPRQWRPPRKFSPEPQPLDYSATAQNPWEQGRTHTRSQKGKQEHLLSDTLGMNITSICLRAQRTLNRRKTHSYKKLVQLVSLLLRKCWGRHTSR